MSKGLTVKVELIGAKELDSFLREFPKRVVKKALRQAVNAGATPLLQSVRRKAAQVPRESGTLAKSISKKVKSYPTGNAIAIVGASKDTVGSYHGRRRIASFYWHLILGGVKPHATGKGSSNRRGKKPQHGGRNPGFAGRPILAEAVAETASQVASIMQAKLASVLEKEAAKLAAK